MLWCVINTFTPHTLLTLLYMLYCKYWCFNVIKCIVFIRVCNMYCIILQGCSWRFGNKLTTTQLCVLSLQWVPQPLRNEPARLAPNWSEYPRRFWLYLVCISAARCLVWLSLRIVWICIVPAMLLRTGCSGTSDQGFWSSEYFDWAIFHVWFIRIRYR